MDDDALWEIERGFWTKGRPHYARHWSPDAVAAFPLPAGIMAGDGFVAGLPDAGAWDEITMEDAALRRPSAACAVLAYHATGSKADGTTYRCICSSTYLAEGTDWVMIQHSQIPISPK